MGWIPGQLEQLRAARKEDAQRRGVEAYATPCNMVMALMAQVGELADIFQYQDDSPGRTVVSWSQRDRRQLNEGLADVLLSLVSLSDVCQNDLGFSAQRRLAQVTRSTFPQHTGVPAPSPAPTPATQQQQQQQQQQPPQHVPPVFPERRQLPEPQQQQQQQPPPQPAPVPAKPAAPAPAPAPAPAAAPSAGPVHHPTPYHAERAKELAAHTAMREREAGAVAAAAEAAARQRQQERQHEQQDRETSASVSPPLPAMVPCPIFPVSSGEDVRSSRRYGGSSAGGSGSGGGGGGGGGARRSEEVLCPLLPEHAGQGKSKAESCHSVPQKHSKGHSVMCASNSGSSSATHSTVWSIAPSPPMSPLDEKELLTRTRTEAIHNAVAAAVSAAAAQQRQVPNGTAAAPSANSSPAAPTPAPTTTAAAAPETSAAAAAAAAAYLPPPQPKRGLRRTLTVVLPKTSWADEEKLYSPTHFDKDLFSPCVHQGELTFDAGNMPTAAHRKPEHERPNGCAPAAAAPAAAAPRKVPSPGGKAVSPAKSPINHTRLSRFLNKDPPDACRSDQDVASDGQSIASDGGASFTDFSAVLAELERGASEWPQEDFDEMEVTFSIPYNGQIHDLLPDGRHMKVQFERLPDYVALARHKLAVLQSAESSRGYIQSQREQRTSPSASPVNK